jgi:hypothetical protein
MSMRRFALVDERHVEDSRFLRRTLGMPRLLRREPVIDPGQSYGSVLLDRSGLWRMWYCTFLTRDVETDLVGSATPEHLAYSRDGIAWEKPALGVVDERGSPERNLIIGEKQRDGNGRYLSGYGGVAGFCVLDSQTHPHPKARARFTALYTSYPRDSIGGILLASSEDGIHWEAWPENPVFPGNQDTQNTFLYDPALGRYVCYHRPMIYCGVAAHANRKMARCESEDLIHWSPGEVVLDTDEGDSPAWEIFDEPGMLGQRARIRQFQGLTPWICNGGYLGLAWMYESREGWINIELVHSPDGRDWRREAMREPFLDAGRPEGLSGRMFTPNGSPPVLVGDDEFFYGSAMPHGHHDGALADIGQGSRSERRRFLETTSIYAFAVKRDRWISYDANDREGELLSRPVGWEGGRFCLNAQIAAGGSIGVEVEDEWARPLKDWHLDDIPAIQGPRDAVEIPVTFGPGPKCIMKLPTSGRLRFRFRLREAKLFGWSLNPG